MPLQKRRISSFFLLFSFISWTLGDTPVPSPAPLQPRGGARGFRTERSAPTLPCVRRGLEQRSTPPACFFCRLTGSVLKGTFDTVPRCPDLLPEAQGFPVKVLKASHLLPSNLVAFRLRVFSFTIIPRLPVPPLTFHCNET